MKWQAAIRARLGGLDLHVELAGDATPLAIVGPNGSGKTSLLRVIAGALPAAAGHITVGQRTLHDDARGIHLAAEQRGVGYVPQGYRLFPHLRVIDNVAFGLSTGPRRQTRDARRNAALGMLRELDASHLATRWPAQLSGGEQQRVALARALITDPDFLLLDEPLSAIDVSARRVLRGLLATRLASRRRPALVVTHDVRDVQALGANVCVLEAGRVVQLGDLDALRAAPASEFVAEFVSA